ncbi:MAG: hypothetical protein KAX49_06700 [Halanaerobiales bacterium]|nr:hypothetical protein [Halanaerobiales bacterium]
MENYIFILGGKDLEMIEISKILKAHNQKFLDNNLFWGAKLSDYEEQLKNLCEFQIVVGIELFKDISIQQKYIEIDHHNDNAYKPASIEQVAELLGLKLTRYQQLVAKNDTGYIRAMVEFGATQEEIEKIRRADRKCQGVTEKDEKLAEKSIQDHLYIENGVTIVKSLVDKFSSICDRLYPNEKLIVYTDDELNYYGKAAQKLGELYQRKHGEAKVYFGGGENGYFGFSQGSINLLEINTIIREVIEYVGG